MNKYIKKTSLSRHAPFRIRMSKTISMSVNLTTMCLWKLFGLTKRTWICYCQDKQIGILRAEASIWSRIWSRKDQWVLISQLCNQITLTLRFGSSRVGNCCIGLRIRSGPGTHLVLIFRLTFWFCFFFIKKFRIASFSWLEFWEFLAIDVHIIYLKLYSVLLNFLDFSDAKIYYLFFFLTLKICLGILKFMKMFHDLI